MIAMPVLSQFDASVEKAAAAGTTPQDEDQSKTRRYALRLENNRLCLRLFRLQSIVVFLGMACACSMADAIESTGDC